MNENEHEHGPQARSLTPEEVEAISGGIDAIFHFGGGTDLVISANAGAHCVGFQYGGVGGASTCSN